MPPPPVRVVLDTNVMVRGLGNSQSPSGQILEFCDRRMVIAMVSRVVLAEYRNILNDPEVVAKYPSFSAMKVEAQLARLAYIGDMIRNTRVRFEFPRDPKDAKFVELAIAGEAAAIITGDRDLLALPTGRDETAKRFRQRLPSTVVVRPDVFFRWFDLRRLHLN